MLSFKEYLKEDAKGHFSDSGGMTKKGVDAYNRANQIGRAHV